MADPASLTACQVLVQSLHSCHRSLSMTAGNKCYHRGHFANEGLRQQGVPTEPRPSDTRDHTPNPTLISSIVQKRDFYSFEGVNPLSKSYA